MNHTFVRKPEHGTRVAMSFVLGLSLVLSLYGFAAQTAEPASQSSIHQLSIQQPASSAPVAKPASTPYRLAAGDSFDLSFRYTPEFSQTVVVQPDGLAVVNVAGEIQAGGRTLQEIHDEIAALATAKLVHPDFTVALKDFEHPRFVVAGEVTSPGRYELRGPTTALQAILSAGGQKETASMSHVVLFRRAGGDVMEVHHLNFGKIDYGKRLGSDMLLQPGDMILVPRDNVAKFGRYVRTFNLGVYFNPNTGALP